MLHTNETSYPVVKPWKVNFTAVSNIVSDNSFTVNCTMTRSSVESNVIYDDGSCGVTNIRGQDSISVRPATRRCRCERLGTILALVGRKWWAPWQFDADRVFHFGPYGEFVLHSEIRRRYQPQGIVCGAVQRTLFPRLQHLLAIQPCSVVPNWKFSEQRLCSQR